MWPVNNSNLLLLLFLGVLETEEPQSGGSKWWHWIIESRHSRRVFRILLLFNLLVLVASIPNYWVSLMGVADMLEGGSNDTCTTCTCDMTPDDDDGQRDFFNLQIQFGIIAALDFILALCYSFDFLARLSYHFVIRNKPVS